ncbi:MAG: histidine kinase [Clostridia bacterium]|nr:histidine kinase [Clostridia bacterium]MBQ9212168.1 histidine kinase [Clostridia bacterium]
MKKRFFFRRAVKYFLIMVAPTVLLFAAFMVNAISSQEKQLRYDGQMTLDAAVENCDMTLNGLTVQNDLLTGSSRMRMALSRILTNKEISYTDSVFLYSLRTTLSSMVDGNPTLERIVLWLDDAPRALTSDGPGIEFLSTMTDFSWKEAYQMMEPEQRIGVRKVTDGSGLTRVLMIRRMLQTHGCAVTYINSDRWIQSLHALLHRQNEYLMVLNSEGELLVSVTNDGRPFHFDQTEIMKLLTAQDGTWIQAAGEHFLFDRSTGENFILLSGIPRRTMAAAVSEVWRTFLLILLVDLAVVMTLAWVTTRRLTGQMHDIIQMFDDAMHERPVKKPDFRKHRDESDIIMDNIIYMYLKDNALRDRVEEAVLRKENAELMALQLQINPHFLYNTLQTMDFAILTGKADKQELSDVFHDLSGILKYALSSPQEPVVLADELDCLKRYVDIQRYRFGDQFVLYIEMEEKLKQAQVFRMMLQPLVENSMIHGLNGLKERGYIWVRAARNGDRLTVSVTDSGAGMTEEERIKLLKTINDAGSRSIGLTNLNRRLILSYGKESALRIDSVPFEETTVSFEIPYKSIISCG